MTQDFKTAYGVLQRHAQTLRAQTEPNLDDLLTIVTESVDAYKVCQGRIAAVEQALNEALADVQQPSLAASRTGTSSSADGEVPF